MVGVKGPELDQSAPSGLKLLTAQARGSHEVSVPLCSFPKCRFTSAPCSFFGPCPLFHVANVGHPGEVVLDCQRSLHDLHRSL